MMFDLIQEYLLILKNYILLPFVKAPSNWKIGTKGDVVLVQGFAENFLQLKTIADYLNSQGYKIHVINYLNWQFFSIEKGMEILEKYIASKRLKNIIFLSHSKGGLVVKKYLQNHTEVVKCAINIATPYHGTIFGKLHILSLSELASNSLNIIDSTNNQKGNDKILNLYPAFDNHVIPNSSLVLNGAKNIEIDVMGHTRILESPKTIAEIDRYLR